MKKNKLPYALSWVVKHKEILNNTGFEKFAKIPNLTLGTFFHKKFFPKKHEDALQSAVDSLVGNDTWKIFIDMMVEKYVAQKTEFRKFSGERHIKDLAKRQKENILDTRHQQTFDNMVMMYTVLIKKNSPLAEYLVGKLTPHIGSIDFVLNAAVMVS